jgi:uncharacterized damage-inducible protein DinB
VNKQANIGGALCDAWRTNARATELLVRGIPPAIWDQRVPGVPARTVRMIAAHLHNARARWIRTLGSEHGIQAPPLVNPRTVPRRDLLAALSRSAAGIDALLELALANGGVLPPSRGYVWRNLPLDGGHVLTYFVAHEGHHRGQLLLIARQLGHRLSREISNGIWQWTTLSRDRRPASGTR